MQITPNDASSDNFIVEATAQTFMQDVVEASHQQPVVVDFWAEWCAPCKQLGPILKKVVSEAGGKVKLVMVDFDQNKSLASQLHIQSIPTVMAFYQGQPIDGFQGAVPESQVKQFIDGLLKYAPENKTDEMVAAARQAMEAKDYPFAISALAQVAQAEPHNATALALLARCYIFMNHLDEAEQILNTISPDKKNDSDVSQAIAALEMARQAGNVGDLDTLEKMAKENPEDMQAQFDLALAYQATGSLDQAGETLIHMIKTDREWNEEAARNQLLKMFSAEGQTSPFTLTYRRKLSSLLFA